MKSFTSILILVFLVSLNSYSQGCLPEGVVFDQQEEIDNFSVNYPGCSIIEGDVTITGEEITNVNGLSQLSVIEGNLYIGQIDSINSSFNLTDFYGLHNLYSIGGDLIVKRCDGLVNLYGLDNFTSISGDLVIQQCDSLINLVGLEELAIIGGSLRIISNQALINLAGLESLTEVSESIEILFNPSIVNLEGLNNLSTVGGYFDLGFSSFFTGNISLSDISALTNLTFIGGNLEIEDLPSLTSLTGLENLSVIGGSLMVNDNQSLGSIAELESLSSIGGNLELKDNPVLASLNGLEGVNEIDGHLIINNNEDLSSLSGLENISPSSIENLNISENPLLSTCHIQTICEFLQAPNGTVDIFNNGEGCSNAGEIAQMCGFTMSCSHVDNFYFYSQYDVDNFQTYFPDCTEIDGNFLIYGNSISNLYGLNVITSISGDLNISWTDSLTSLSGLEGLTNIGGGLTIFSTNNLYNLAGLENLTSIEGDVVIGQNQSLLNLTGLEGLTIIGGGLLIGGFGSSNPDLTSLTGLENLASISGILGIVSNYSLNNIAAMDNMDPYSINELVIRLNYSLSVCEAESICAYITSPNGNFQIYDNAPGCNSSGQVLEACEIVDIEEDSNYYLNQKDINIYPNPFNTSTNIEYLLESPQKVTITFYNSLGETVDIITEQQQSGLQTVKWNPKELNEGVYFFRFERDGHTTTGKVYLKK